MVLQEVRCNIFVTSVIDNIKLILCTSFEHRFSVSDKVPCVIRNIRSKSRTWFDIVQSEIMQKLPSSLLELNGNVFLKKPLTIWLRHQHQNFNGAHRPIQPVEIVWLLNCLVKGLRVNNGNSGKFLSFFCLGYQGKSSNLSIQKLFKSSHFTLSSFPTQVCPNIYPR